MPWGRRPRDRVALRPKNGVFCRRGVTRAAGCPSGRVSGLQEGLQNSFPTPHCGGLWSKRRQRQWCQWGAVMWYLGSRVWLRHKELLLPSTVNSCDEISLVVTTDYGKVSRTSPEAPDAAMTCVFTAK
ncbi:unnamed protein product [Arctogadus glacialis]